MRPVLAWFLLLIKVFFLLLVNALPKVPVTDGNRRYTASALILIKNPD